MLSEHWEGKDGAVRGEMGEDVGWIGLEMITYSIYRHKVGGLLRLAPENDTQPTAE